MDYQEQDVSGKKWTRVFQINLSNIYGQAPAAAFQEEERVAIDGGGTFGSFKGSINVEYTDPAKQSVLRDPETDEALSEEACALLFASLIEGTLTDQQFFVIMYSRSRQAQVDRDNQQQG